MTQYHLYNLLLLLLGSCASLDVSLLVLLLDDVATATTLHSF